MKTTWDSKSKKPTVVLDETDFADGVRIHEMIQGEFLCRKCGNTIENNAWQILSGYFESMRLLLEEKMKSSIETKAGRDSAPTQIAKLAGFDHFYKFPQNIVDQMMLLQEAINKNKEKDNGNGNEYGD